METLEQLDSELARLQARAAKLEQLAQLRARVETQEAELKPWLDNQKVIRAVEEECGVTWTEIVSRCRTDRIASARAIFCYFALQTEGARVSQIGRLIKRHHTTVIYAIQNVAVRREAHPQFNLRINRIAAAL